MAEELMSQVHFVRIPLVVPRITELNEFWSEEKTVQGITWKLKVFKKTTAPDDGDSLGVFLCCTKPNDKSNWSHAALATFYLLPFTSGPETIILKSKPLVFDRRKNCTWNPCLIKWDNLFDNAKGYVQENTIQVDVSIMVANPNDINRSVLKVHEKEYTNHENTCVALYELTVFNIKHLMAVTERINLQNIGWNFIVYKDKEDTLSIDFRANNVSNDASCMMGMKVELISSYGRAHSAHIPCMDIKCAKGLAMNIISWADLLNPNHGYVQENFIQLYVQLELNSPSNIPLETTVARNIHEKLPTLKCTQCLFPLIGQNFNAISCGHVFCTVCVKNVTENGQCPCKFIVTTDSIHSYVHIKVEDEIQVMFEQESNESNVPGAAFQVYNE